MQRAGGIGAGGAAFEALSRIDAARPIAEPRGTGPSTGPGSGSDGNVDFAGVLGQALSGAGNAERAASDAATRFAAGDPEVGIHEVVIAAEKANVSVRYAVTLKNRAIEAYRELLNTPV